MISRLSGVAGRALWPQLPFLPVTVRGEMPGRAMTGGAGAND